MTALIISVIVLALIVLFFVGKAIYDAVVMFLYGIYRDGYLRGYNRMKEDREQSLQELAEQARIDAFKRLLKSL